VDLVSKHESGGQHDADVLAVEAVDHSASAWSRIRRSVYDVQQRFRYEYAAPISDLRQRLVVVPRPVHGNQRLLSHGLAVSEARFRRRMRADQFGNVVLQISIPKVEEAVDFDVSLVVERTTGQGPHLEAARTQALDDYLLGFRTFERVI
jgi:transglutaminase-like putative cysteine protease